LFCVGNACFIAWSAAREEKIFDDGTDTKHIACRAQVHASTPDQVGQQAN